MAELFNRKIIIHRFRVDDDEGDTGIGYAMIISHVLMVQIASHKMYRVHFECHNFLAEI